MSPAPTLTSPTARKASRSSTSKIRSGRASTRCSTPAARSTTRAPCRSAAVNASMFALVADGRNGLRVVQLISPDTVPGAQGFSPRPNPKLIATYHTTGEAIAVGADSIAIASSMKPADKRWCSAGAARGRFISTRWRGFIEPDDFIDAKDIPSARRSLRGGRCRDTRRQTDDARRRRRLHCRCQLPRRVRPNRRLSRHLCRFRDCVATALWAVFAGCRSCLGGGCTAHRAVATQPLVRRVSSGYRFRISASCAPDSDRQCRAISRAARR